LLLRFSNLLPFFSSYPGHQTEGRHVLSFSFILTSRTLDLEAFTPEDRDFWVESFNGLISFFKAQPIPQPNRAASVATGPVSSL